MVDAMVQKLHILIKRHFVISGIIMEFEKFIEIFNSVLNTTTGVVVFENVSSNTKMYLYEGTIEYAYKEYLKMVDQFNDVIIRPSYDNEDTDLY